jgi:hypothetical protein
LHGGYEATPIPVIREFAAGVIHAILALPLVGPGTDDDFDGAQPRGGLRTRVRRVSRRLRRSLPAGGVRYIFAAHRL